MDSDRVDIQIKREKIIVVSSRDGKKGSMKTVITGKKCIILKTKQEAYLDSTMTTDIQKNRYPVQKGSQGKSKSREHSNNKKHHSTQHLRDFISAPVVDGNIY